MFISGTSGHACEDTQHKYPYMIDGHILKLNTRKTIYELDLQQDEGGTITGTPTSGEHGTIFELSAQANNHFTFDSFSVSGTELSGSSGTFINSDVTAKANWIEDPKYNLVINQTSGGILSGSPMTGYSGDKFKLIATPSAKYAVSDYQVTGTTLTGVSGTYPAGNVTAQASWVYVPETVVYKTFGVASKMPALAVRNQNDNINKVYVLAKVNNEYQNGCAFCRAAADATMYVYPTLAGNAYTTDPWYPTSWTDSGAFMPTPTECFFGDKKQYFGKTVSTTGGMGPSTATIYTVDKGISFQNGGFISGFAGEVVVNVGSDLRVKYRVIYNNVTGDWSDRTYGPTYGSEYMKIPLTADVVSSNDPFIIQISGNKTSYGTVVTGNVAFMNTSVNSNHPCWSGKLCYKE